MENNRVSKTWQTELTSKLFLMVTMLVVLMTISIIAIPFLFDGAAIEEPSSKIIYLFSVAVMVLSCLMTILFYKFNVEVSQDGLTVTSWLLKLPLKRIPLHEIEKVESGFLYPSEWGGWGYRIMVGRSAIVLKAGPGLIITLKNKKEFGLSLENPDEPAALLKTLKSEGAC